MHRDRYSPMPRTMRLASILLATAMVLMSQSSFAIPGFGELGLGASTDALSETGKLTFRKVARFGISSAQDAKIVQELQLLANSNQAEAINVLGWLIDNGYFGVAKDSALASQYFARASQAGLAAAKYNLATQYFWGRGQAQNSKAALGLLNSIQIHDLDGRICGLKSYITYKLGDTNAAYQLALQCKEAPLALIALALGTQDTRQANDYAARFAGISPEIYAAMIQKAKTSKLPDSVRDVCVWSALARSYQMARLAPDACLSNWEGTSSAKGKGGANSAMNPALTQANQLKQKIQNYQKLYDIAYSRSIPYAPFSMQNEAALEKHFNNFPSALRAKAQAQSGMAERSNMSKAAGTPSTTPP